MSEEKQKDVVKLSFETLKQIKADYSKEQIAYIIKNVAPTLNHDECYLFIMRCHKLGIDPMSGDITAYISKAKRKTDEGKYVYDRKLTMIVARNWKREQGMKNPHVKSVKVEAIYTDLKEVVERTYDANKVKIDSKDSKNFKIVGDIVEKVRTVTGRVPAWSGGVLWGAKCTIVRDDYTEPFTVTVPLKEYRGSKVWGDKPETMIKKVAESQCWDLAVPELSRVYDESESFEKAEEIKGAEKPASPEQKSLIKSMGGKTKKGLTKQGAIDLIEELNAEPKSKS